MAYHKSNLGSFAPAGVADMNGYIPEATDGPWDLSYDHGTERTHNDDGTLTEYGQWWEEEGFPERQTTAAEATEAASAALAEWQRENV